MILFYGESRVRRHIRETERLLFSAKAVSIKWMGRTLKRVGFGTLYLAILFLVAGGVYFLFFKPDPTCSDNKRNQREAAVDCGGPCIPCEVKGVDIVVEEARIFSAGEGWSNLLVRLKNPSQNFNASFAYQFEVDGIPSQVPGLRGKRQITPGTSEYIVAPAFPANARSLNSVGLKITDLTWNGEVPVPPKLRTTSQTNVDGDAITVSGTLFNDSPQNLSLVNLNAVLFDKEGRSLNASLAQLKEVEAFSRRPFIIFFPAVEGLPLKTNPNKTFIQWDLND